MKELIEWAENYIKNRDLTLRKIISLKVDEKSNVIDVKFKDKTVRHQIYNELNDTIFAGAGNRVIICLNSKENFNFLIKNWGKLSKIKDFSIIFVNLKHNDKWLINPYVHSMIADPDSLEAGLKAMFDAANGELKEPKMEKKKPQIFDEDVASEDDSEEN
jgi:hypothetical protein